MNGTLAPVPKVAAGWGGGAATVLIVWLLGAFGVDMPAEVAAALTAVIAGAAAWLRPAGGDGRHAR